MSTALAWYILCFILIQVLGWWLFYILHNRTMRSKPYFAVKNTVTYANWGTRHPRKYREWLVYKRVLRERRARARATGFKRLYYILIDQLKY